MPNRGYTDEEWSLERWGPVEAPTILLPQAPAAVPTGAPSAASTVPAVASAVTGTPAVPPLWGGVWHPLMPRWADAPADNGPGSTIAIGIPVTPKESARQEAGKPAQVSAPPAETVATTPEVSNEPVTAPATAQAEEPAAEVPREAASAQAEEEPATMKLEVIIPDGVKPGDVFEVKFDGKMVQVDVPEGCRPGSAISILLPVTPKGSKGEEAPATTVPAEDAVPDEPSNETAALIEIAEQVPEPHPAVVPLPEEAPAGGNPEEVEYTDHHIEVPIHKQVHVPVVVPKTVKVPQVRYEDQIVQVPIQDGTQVHVPIVQMVQNTSKVAQIQYEDHMEIPAKVQLWAAMTIARAAMARGSSASGSSREP